MNELLQNEAVQAALITLIVVALNALIAWIKTKTKGSIIEANWCYLQPVVAAFIVAVQSVAKDAEDATESYMRIIAKSLAEFTTQYNLLEGKEPTAAEIKAVKAELYSTLQRVLGV